MDYEISIFYYPGKAKMVVDALGRLSMGSVSYSEVGREELAYEVHRLYRLEIWLADSIEGSILV